MCKVVAVVVTYNRKELLRKCLTELLGQTIQCDIILVDNASTDGTKEMVKAEFSVPQLKYINSGANLGCSGGNEIGVGEAVKAGYKYIWIMDDDTIPQSDSLEKLLRGGQALHGKWGCLSSVVKWTDGSMCRANRQKKTLFSFVSDKEITEKRFIRCEMVSFVSMLVRAEVVKKIGLPKGEYFIWTDDYDFSGRISRHYPIYLVTDSVVRHAMKENKKANFAIETGERIDRYQYLYRNDVDCYRQFGLRGWVYILLKDLYGTANLIIHSKGETSRKVAIIWKGFVKGVKFRPETKMI